jgi:hypothetical protein
MRFLKLFTGLAGLVAVFASVPVLVSGVALFSWSATESSTTLPTVAIATSERAVVAGDIDVFAGDRRMFLPTVTEASLRVSDNEPLFVGIGRTTDVERFLASGSGAPGEQTFWAHTSDGTSNLIDWDIEEGRWTAVVMNADGSPGVDATVQAAVPSAPLRVAGAMLSVMGLGIGVVGALLVGAAWGGRRSSRQTPHSATVTA